MASEKTVREHTLTTDVLVIGAGFAGLFAAMRARELGADVLIVEYGKSGFTGMSAIGSWHHRVILPDDDFDLALKAVVLDTDYMVDQEYAEGALHETWDRFQQFIKLGANFVRDGKGEIAWHFRNTSNPPYRQRIAVWEPKGSYKHTLGVKSGAVHLGAKVLDRILVTDLLTSNGKVVGAVGFNTKEGDFYIFKAKAVIMASGSTCSAASGLGAGRLASLTQDGCAMALRAGGELRGMEFGKNETGSRQVPVEPYTVYGHGESEDIIKFVNAKGEEFIEKYEILHRRPDRIYMGPPWKNHIPAVMKEYLEGRGPCYIQLRTPEEHKYEFGFGGHGSAQGGGIRIDPYGVTNVPGLFAGGQASDMCGAAHYTVPSNMMGASITGRRAGESAAQYAKAISPPTVDKDEISRLKADLYAPLDRQKGITEAEVHIRLIDLWPNLDFRNETRLNKALQELKQLEQDEMSLVASDPHELANCIKIRNYTPGAQASALAALTRCESRLEHFREDYPLRDNKNWLKWVIVHGTGDKMETYLEDVPVEKWKYRPDPDLPDDRLQLRKERSS
jgi:succinate dehydrogenase/fumarate reductase flavoprotein subunit